jgi:hypothetical protein
MDASPPRLARTHRGSECSYSKYYYHLTLVNEIDYYSVIDYQSVACKGWCPEYSTAFILVFVLSRERKR